VEAQQDVQRTKDSQVPMGMAMNDDPRRANLSLVDAFNPAFLAANVRLQRPLSRRGNGPGLVIFVPEQQEDNRVPAPKKTLDPVPLQKWAEEGFAVIEITIGPKAARRAGDVLSVQDACERGIEALKSLPGCIFEGRLGVIGR
jgi:carboxymethylenebutenolidase